MEKVVKYRNIDMFFKMLSYHLALQHILSLEILAHTVNMEGVGFYCLQSSDS